MGVRNPGAEHKMAENPGLFGAKMGDAGKKLGGNARNWKDLGENGGEMEETGGNGGENWRKWGKLGYYGVILGSSYKIWGKKVEFWETSCKIFGVELGEIGKKMGIYEVILGKSHEIWGSNWGNGGKLGYDGVTLGSSYKIWVKKVEFWEIYCKIFGVEAGEIGKKLGGNA